MADWNILAEGLIDTGRYLIKDAIEGRAEERRAKVLNELTMERDRAQHDMRMEEEDYRQLFEDNQRSIKHMETLDRDRLGHEQDLERLTHQGLIDARKPTKANTKIPTNLKRAYDDQKAKIDTMREDIYDDGSDEDNANKRMLAREEKLLSFLGDQKDLYNAGRGSEAEANLQKLREASGRNQVQ